MTTYQGLAKKYRPQKFSEVFQQDPIVQTIKNALRLGRVGHAYIFCGTRGTGKTTLARLFAKALNCHNLSDDQEPCNNCPSCKEVVSGHSLDVIEVDGASNRGIDDIRNLNETVGYASSAGKYKIYIIDEVHMLTKEAFNALLKTLEEPPEHVIFFFATTEPHKVLPTIISRCQRFDLKRISPEKILEKLKQILLDLGFQAEEDALHLIAAHADGSLRDAESLLDRLLCFHEGEITAEKLSETLGLVSRDLFFKLDQAAHSHDLLFAFQLSEQVFNEGAHLEYFLENLANHYRHLLVIKLGKAQELNALLTAADKEKYLKSAALYTQEQCLEILDILRSQLEQLPKSPFKRIDLEILLLQIIRSMKKMPLDQLVHQLVELKSAVSQTPTEPKEMTSAKEELKAQVAPLIEEPSPPKNVTSPKQEAPPLQLVTEPPPQQEVPTPQPVTTPLPKSEPPSPAPEEATPPPQKAPPQAEAPPPQIPAEKIDNAVQKKIRHDKVMRFASVELNGSIRKG
ncbi:DNA polymerase III subunit gamma/tau [Simkania sp.]|uniref:DNA polymerase III subunit gamma/tau n=1 Tax=Simkania sp. TaxID=34094 RepID=UPI003B520701